MAELFGPEVLLAGATLVGLVLTTVAILRDLAARPTITRV